MSARARVSGAIAMRLDTEMAPILPGENKSDADIDEPSIKSVAALSGEPIVDCMYDNGALSDAGGHSLDRIGAHVADGKDARNARCVRRRQRLAGFYVAGLYEPVRVKIDTAIEPIGIRHGADHQEKIRCQNLRFRAVLIAPSHGFEVFMADQSRYVASCMKCDLRGFFDAPDKIIRHRCREPVAPDKNMNASRLEGQIDGGLTCRISATYHKDLGGGAKAALHRRRRILHNLTFETRQVTHIKAPITRPRGHVNGTRPHHRSAF